MVHQMEHVVTAHARPETAFQHLLQVAHNCLQLSPEDQTPFSGLQGYLPAFTQAHTHTQTHMHMHIIKNKS